ncbi:phage tail protein, partial [Desulfovibrio sp. 1214_IL3152]
AVTTVLQVEFARLAPGESLVLSRLLAAVSSLDGVADVVIREPGANVVPSALEWCRLGYLMLEAL